ncbi:MOSC domain-containing protein [Lentibacillus sediminis]|uniref:MOSC domain-containing protein n=1 Tax=Lentibacillus sediminis TaxID=1940529 RepID=UPI000C1BF85B|nr:MOSC domain-containing protein [Lentibacillus sediminis]
MKNTPIKLINLATGLPKKMQYGQDKEMMTGIQKELVEEAFLSKTGFDRDDVADKKNHGGMDRAVCVYPYEHYAQWEQEFDRPLPAAAFGENLTITGMLEKDVCIGDTYQLGEAVIQITQGRIPCSTINKRTGIPTLLQRFVGTGYSGYLCRVLEEGTVRMDAEVKLIQRHPERVPVHAATMIHLHGRNDREGMERVLQVDELADKWRKKLEKRLGKL